MRIEMRSLFTKDILGAAPKPGSYTKDSIISRHQDQVRKFGPNQKRVFEWYSPPKRFKQPIDRQDFDYKIHGSLKRRNSCIDSNVSQNSLQLSKNMKNSNPQSSFLKDHAINSPQNRLINKKQDISPQLSKSSLLSETGVHSLNPYFPHRYSQEQSRWTGTRDWNPISENKIMIPGASNLYVSKWW